MPYTPTNWVDGVTRLGPTNLNHLEGGVQTSTTTAEAAIPKPSSPANNEALVWNGTTWTSLKVGDANVSPTAAIAYSKLALTNSIANSDVAATAAIAASKLNLVGAIPPTGSVVAYIWTSAPTGWSLLDGTARKRSGTDPGDGQDYSALFGLVGTQYGSGDGSTTFNLPDLRGRMPVGKGSNATVNSLGANEGGGAESNRQPRHAHNVGTDTPDHSHNVEVFSGTNTAGAVAGGNPAGSDLGAVGSSGATSRHTHAVGTGLVTDAPAFLTLNFIVKL